MNARSQYKIYTDWCINKHILVKDYQNHFKEVNDDMLRQCMNTYLKDKNIVTRDNLIEKCENNLMNPAERFILLGLFEGIGSDPKGGYKDFENLRIECFNTETHELQLCNRIIKYSDLLYKLAKEAADAYELVTYDRSGNERSYKLLDDDRVVKPGVNATTCNYRNIIGKKIAKIKQELNNPAINIQSLKESGRIDMIKRKMAEGKTLEEALSDPDVVNTYGRILSKKRYISNYFAE